MNPKQIDVTCPCCNTRLTVDVLTRTILRHAPPGQVDETGKAVLDEGRWDAAAEKVKGRRSDGQDKFDSALDKERSRTRDLDELFDRAKKKALEEPDEQ